jgi:hypothetical protein
MILWQALPGACGDVYAVVADSRSGGVLPGGDDDVVAEGLELALGVAGLAAAVGVPGVPVGAEVAVGSPREVWRPLCLRTAC